MKIKFLTAGALASLAIAAAAHAQAAAPAPTGAVGGPVIPGVCTYSNERAIGTSLVGQAVQARMKQIAAAAQSELQSQQTALQTEKRSIDAQRASATQDQFEARANAFNQKAAGFERLRAQRVQELQATEQKAYGRVATEIDPLLKQVYAERNCGLLLDRENIFGANPQMDVTDLVVQRLNGKLTTLSFERENLTQAAQPGMDSPVSTPSASAPAPAHRPTKK